MEKDFIVISDGTKAGEEPVIEVQVENEKFASMNFGEGLITVEGSDVLISFNELEAMYEAYQYGYMNF